MQSAAKRVEIDMSKAGPFRGGTVRWAHGLADAKTPVFLLDAKRRLLLFNAGCQESTGWSSEEILGLICDFVTVADSHSREAVLAACAPPAEVWEGKPAELPVLLPHRTSVPQARRVRFQPLLNEDQRVTLVLGTFCPEDVPVTSTITTPAQEFHAQLAALRHQLRSRYGEDSVIALSLPMQRALTQLQVAAPGARCVLFVGEAGTGREHLARTLHARGPLARFAFTPVDCRKTESTDLKRIIKHLSRGTETSDFLQPGAIYLNQIDAAPRDVQERLVEVLTSLRSAASAQVMAATACSLKDLVEQDLFLPELYYLLTAVVVEVPPLRERTDDLLPLAQFFLEAGNFAAEKQLTGFSPEAIDALRRYQWPGNVDELLSVVQSAIAAAQGSVVAPDDFPISFRAGQEAQRLGPTPMPRIVPLETVLAQVEREQIQAALSACRSNLTKAAELLGLSRPKLYRRLEALGLLPETPADPTP